jgi:hypothetical protein
MPSALPMLPTPGSGWNSRKFLESDAASTLLKINKLGLIVAVPLCLEATIPVSDRG